MHRHILVVQQLASPLFAELVCREPELAEEIIQLLGVTVLAIPVGSRKDVFAARIETQQKLPILLRESIGVRNLPLNLVLTRHQTVVEDTILHQIGPLRVAHLDVPLRGDTLNLVESEDQRVLELDHLAEVPVGPLMTVIGRTAILHRLELEDLDRVQIERWPEVVILHHVLLEHTVPHLSDRLVQLFLNSQLLLGILSSLHLGLHPSVDPILRRLVGVILLSVAYASQDATGCRFGGGDLLVTVVGVRVQQSEDFAPIVETVRSHRLGVDLRRFRLIEFADLSDDLLGGIFFVVGGGGQFLVETTRGELQAELVVAAFGLLELRLDLATTGYWDLDYGFHFGFLSIAQSVLPVNVHLCMYTCQHDLCKKVKIISIGVFGSSQNLTQTSPANAELVASCCT